MYSKAEIINELLVKHIFHIKNDFSVRKIYPDLEPNNTTRKNTVSEINKAADDFFSAYEAFYQTARNEFSVQYALKQ